MKKFAKIFTMIAICFVCAFGFVACGKNPIVSAVVKNGTLITTVVKDQEVDTSSVEVVLTYKDKTTKTVKTEDLKFSNVDTSTTGEKDLTITYEKENYSFTVKIKVVASEADVISVISLESELVQDFVAKKNATGVEQTEFRNHDDYIYAGTENTFHFRIKATGVDLEGNPLSNLKKVRTVVTVAVMKYSSWVVLSDENVADYMTINTEDATFKFKDSAIQEEAFRITVKAANPEAGMEEANVSFTAEVKVIDAFNVYTEKELCAFDNTTTDINKSFDWSEIKEEVGVAGKNIKGIILQSDLSVTKDDVPADVFWTRNSPNFKTAVGKVDGGNGSQANREEKLIGTPIDKAGCGIYRRRVVDGDDFQFVGNFFTIDFSKFPKMIVETNGSSDYVYVEKGEIMTAHLSAFFVEKQNDKVGFTQETKMLWKNIAFSGNGGLSEDPTDSIANSGGLLMMKVNNVNFTAYNTLTNNFYIGYFFKKGNENPEFEGNYLVDKCAGYYSYQCLFYMQGAKNVIIRDSKFKHASGPAIISDHLSPGKTGDGIEITRMDIIHSTIESKVSAASPWLGKYGGTTIIQGISQANPAIYAVEKATPTIAKDLLSGSKTIKDDKGNETVYEVYDLVALIKSSEEAGATSARVQGYIRFFDSDDEYKDYYDKSNPKVTTYGLDLMKDSKNHINAAKTDEFDANLIDIAISAGNTYFQDALTGKYVDGATARAIQEAIGGMNKQQAVMTVKGQDTTVADAGKRLTAASKYVNVYTGTGMGAIFGVGGSNK